jgi:hypothetical protein
LPAALLDRLRGYLSEEAGARVLRFVMRRAA